MAEVIKDGRGRGYYAAVDPFNRLETHTVSVTELVRKALRGEAFYVQTGVLTLTTATASDVLLIRNAGAWTWVIASVGFYFEASDGIGSVETIGVEGSSDLTPSTSVVAWNTKLGDTREPVGTFLTGDQGSTFVDGVVRINGLRPAPQAATFAFPIIIPSGRSFGVRLVPPPGNTSMRVVVSLAFYEYLEEES